MFIKKAAACIVVITLLSVTSARNPEMDVYEIPAGYRGSIFVIVDEPCGVKLELKKRKRLIKVPSEGILIVQDEKLHTPFDGVAPKDGTIVSYKHKPTIYYEIDKSGEKKLLPEVQEYKFDRGDYQYSKDEIFVFHTGIGTISIPKQWDELRHDTISVSFYELFVGSYNHIKSDDRKKNKENDMIRVIRRLRTCWEN